jgi:DNA-binding transcriptional LysR family regulator
VNLEFRQLEVFCAVVSLRSFSRAAKRVYLSQASVSERIAALEDQVGCRLLDRSRRGGGVHPTPLGAALYKRAARLLKDREHAVQELQDLLGVRRGTVQIGASTVPGTYYLPEVIKQFSSLYPETSFSVSIAGSEHVVDSVVDGRLEAGIVGDPGERQIDRLLRGQGGTQRTRLWSDEFVLIAPSGHPLGQRRRVPLAELTDVPFVMREAGSGTRRWLELYLQDELPGGAGELKVAAEMGSLCAVKQAVIQGLGVSLVSACAVKAEIKAGLLHAIELEGPKLKRSLYLIHDERRTPSPIGRLFTQFLLDLAPRDLLETERSPVLSGRGPVGE